MTDQQQNATTDRARPVWENAFLKVLRKQGNVTKACAAAKIERSTAYRHKESDKAFAELWQEALDEAADHLEAEAWRRATVGVKKGVYYQGERVDTELEYSDSLLALLLKAHKPEKFRDRQEISGPDGGPIAVKVIDYRTAITPLAPGPMGDSDPSGES